MAISTIVKVPVSKTIKVFSLGLLAYVLFVFLVLNFYPDKPENMDWRDREQYNKVQIKNLELGATQSEVMAVLGAPDITEAKKINGIVVQVMFYRTQHIRADGLTTTDECTPLLFENKRLIALGDGAYQSYLRS